MRDRVTSRRALPLLMALGLSAGPVCHGLPGVLLGGREIPREKFIVFLFIGHSNMAGRDIHRSDSVTHPRAWSYRWFSDKQWVPAREVPGSLKNGLSGRGNGGGGMPLLKRLVAEFPDHYIGAVSNASLAATVRGSVERNSSGMPGDDNRYIKGALLYREITALAIEVKKVAMLGGIFCQLGSIEATRSTQEICLSFSDDVAQMVKDMRADIGEPNLPFILGKYEAGATGEYSPALPNPKIVAEQILMVPGKLPFSALVESQGLEMLDDHHYTVTRGQVEWARRAVEIYKAKGYFPSTTAAIAPFGGKGGGSRMGATVTRKGTPVFLSRQGLAILPLGERSVLVDGRAYAGEIPALIP